MGVLQVFIARFNRLNTFYRYENHGMHVLNIGTPC
jgi:hypothetical protein